MPMTPCPACGAPLEYTGDGETLKCHFCGTVFKVTEEDARPRFEVLGQPGPQKEVLQDGVSQVEDQLAEDLPPAPDAPGDFARVYPSEPNLFQQSYQADLNPPPPAPGTTIHTGEASRWSGIDTPVQAPPLQAPPPGPASRPNATGRWIAIAVAVVLLACMACACAGVLFFAFAQRSGTFQ